MAEGDHVADPRKLPWPQGRYVRVTIGAYVPNGITAGIVRNWVVPFDCYVARVFKDYLGGTAHLDAVSLKTLDAGKNIQAEADESANVVGVAQTVHADVANRAYLINAGDIIQLKVSSEGSNESGHISYDLDLEVAYANTAAR